MSELDTEPGLCEPLMRGDWESVSEPGEIQQLADAGVKQVPVSLLIYWDKVALVV